MEYSFTIFSSFSFVSVPVINTITKIFSITQDHMPRSGSAQSALYFPSSINNKDNLQKYGHEPILY